MKSARKSKLHPIHRITKPILDLLRQEIFAVLAVATLCLVLVFAFNHNLISPKGQLNRGTNGTNQVPSTGGSLLPAWSGGGLATTVSPTQLIEDQFNASTGLGDALYDNQSTINFGSMIKGYNRPGVELWQNEAKVQNQGSYLQVSADNQVTIAGVENGNFSLWLTGRGTITLNGVTFTIRTLNTLKKVVPISNNNLIVRLKSGAQIYTISTLSSDTDIPIVDEATAATIPAKILMIPNKSIVNLGTNGTALLRPIVILTDSAGKQISNTANLISWSSSDEAIATVSASGIVTAKQAGTVTIIALVTGSDLSATITLTVKTAELSPLIDVTPKSAELNVAANDSTPTKTNPIVNLFNSWFR